MNYEETVVESDFDFEDGESGGAPEDLGRLALDEGKVLRIAIGGALIIQGVSLFLQLVIGLVLISNRPRGNFVQLVDGSAVEVGEYDSKYRSPQTIRRFVRETVTELFSWNGYKPVTSLEDSQRRELDPGVAVDRGRVPTSAYYASFALREGLRTSFLRELASFVPREVVRGSSAGAEVQPGTLAVAPPNVQTIVLIGFISEPRKIGDGRWEVVVASTVVELRPNTVGKVILRFNKTLVLRAVEPIRASDELNELKQVLNIRAAGLQIEEIRNYKPE